MKQKAASFQAATAPLVVALVLAGAVAARAAGVVGTGTTESCTEAALVAALTGGGIVTFDCGAAPHTIVVTSIKELTLDTEIDGGGTITLSGANTTAFFLINTGVTVLIDDITLTRGFGAYGAIQNGGVLTIDDSRIEKCNSSGEEGGAIANYGGLTITASTLAENSSVHHGGAIFSFGGGVDISGSTLSGNSTTGSSGAESGGAIYGFFFADIAISDSTLSDNTSISGGGIWSDGTVSLTDVTLDGNKALTTVFGAPKGGALFVDAGTAEITGSTLSDNQALAGNGGGIWIDDDATLTVSRSTFTGNEAQSGGAIANRGTASFVESTFHHNTGSEAVILNGPGSGSAPRAISLTNVTISDNTTESGGIVVTSVGQITVRFTTVANNASEFGAFGEGALGSFVISNSVFADNSPSNCTGFKPGGSQGFNISSDATCGFTNLGDDLSTDPELGPLGDHGGPTLTRVPSARGPAVDEAQCAGDVTTDQRGVARPIGIACDRGAVEVDPETDTTTTTVTTTTTSTTSTLGSTTTTLSGGGGACGDPVALVVSRDAPPSRSVSDASRDARTVSASDALAVLNASVGLFACELCVCDVDNSGAIAATDALVTLRVAVGLSTSLDCPACS